MRVVLLKEHNGYTSSIRKETDPKQESKMGKKSHSHFKV